MPSGVRATVEFSNPDLCPVVELSSAAETTIDSVKSNVCPSGCPKRVVEFSMTADDVDDVRFDPVFSQDGTNRYRMVLDDESACPCRTLAQNDCPAARYAATNGRLTLAFHAADWKQLRDVVAELRDRFPEMDLKRFVRSPAGESARDRVVVDRSKLTDRQIEVLETALEMGYFERPRQTNATSVAAALDINVSTFREHIAAAATKILEDVL